MSEQGREKRDAKQMLLASGAVAVEVIVSLMQDSGLKPELRLKAAESILDRIGGKSGSLEVSGEGIGAVLEAVLAYKAE